MMRKLLTSLLLVASTGAVAQDFVTRYIDECGNDSTEKHVIVSPKMMEMASENEMLQNDEDIRIILAHLKSLQMLKGDNLSDERFTKAEDMLERHSNRYSTIRTFEKETEKIQISIRKYRNKAVELVMLKRSGSRYAILSLTGDLDDEVMERLGNVLGKRPELIR